MGTHSNTSMAEEERGVEGKGGDGATGWMDQSMAMHMRTRTDGVVSRMPLVARLRLAGRIAMLPDGAVPAASAAQQTEAKRRTAAASASASASAQSPLFLSGSSLAHPLLRNSSMSGAHSPPRTGQTSGRSLVAAAAMGRGWQHSCVVQPSAF